MLRPRVLPQWMLIAGEQKHTLLAGEKERKTENHGNKKRKGKGV